MKKICFMFLLFMPLSWVFAAHYMPQYIIVKTPPIRGNIDAEHMCPHECSAMGARWTGEWWTEKVGVTSVCKCKSIYPEFWKKKRESCFATVIRTQDIWNGDDAAARCPALCEKIHAEWTGMFNSNSLGHWSTCRCFKCTFTGWYD